MAGRTAGSGRLGARLLCSSAPQPRPSRLIRAPTRSSKVHEWRCCDREGGVLDRESANKVVDHWRS